MVTITGKPEGATYAQILNKAKQNVLLDNLGIGNVRMRRGINGALIIELPGPDDKRLASSLRNKLEDVLKEDARVSNPVAMGEIRLRGIDPATTQDEIGYALEKISGCSPRELTVSKINFMRDGMGVAWARCPLEHAIKIAETGGVVLGWTVVRLELLKKRPIQCFRCWKFGHVRNNCKAEIDRSGACFRCGTVGHSVKDCNSIPTCVICADVNKDHRHRIGSARCLENQGFSNRVHKFQRAVGGSAPT